MTYDFGAIALHRDDGSPSLYRQIAKAVADAIAEGRLEPGRRLPPQRDLARLLGVNLTTVSRAYAELQRRGLTIGSIGSGTFIREPLAERGGRAANGLDAELIPHDPRLIDLSLNAVPNGFYREHLAATLARLPADPRFAALEDYQPAAGAAWARAAGARWIGRFGFDIDASRMLVTAGVQAGLYATFAASCRPDDVVIVNRVTYFGLKALANLLRLRLRAIETDADGPLPDALDAACADGRARAFFVVPCLDNPTAATIPAERRAALAKIARRHGLLIVEDDVYAPLLTERPPPIATLYPERTVYLTGMSKALAPGLRVGFVLPPEPLFERIADVVRSTSWMSPPLSMLVAASWVEDGTADRVLDAHRQELMARQTLAAERLKGLSFETSPVSTHLWLHLPEPWRATEFAAQLEGRGVRVMASELFAASSDAIPHAVRVNVGAARSREQLEAGLDLILETLRRRPSTLPASVAP